MLTLDQVINRIYVSRTPSADDMVQWVLSDNPSERIYGLWGAAGSGKTTHLHHVRQELLGRTQSYYILYLDLKNAKGTTSEIIRYLARWVDIDAAEKVSQRPGVSVGTSDDADLDVKVRRLATEASRDAPRPTTIFLDSYDDFAENDQSAIRERFIAPWCNQPHSKTRLFVACRDANSIGGTFKTTLKLCELQELTPDARKDLLQKRIALLKEIVDGGADITAIKSDLNLLLESLPSHDADIRKLVDLLRRIDSAELERVTPNLTGNAFVAVSLLSQTLVANLDQSTLAAPDSAAKEGVLARYLEDRAGIGNPPVAHSPLQVMKALVTVLDNPALWSQRELVKNSSARKLDFTFEDLEPYFATGLIRQVRGTARYAIDPPVVDLIQGL